MHARERRALVDARDHGGPGRPRRRLRRRHHRCAGGAARRERARRRHLQHLVDAGNARAEDLGLVEPGFQEGDASRPRDLADDSFDLVVSIFGAMFAPRPFDVAKELVRVTARRADRHGQLDPRRPDARRADPEDQLGVLTAAAGRIRQPDDLGCRERRGRAVTAAGVPKDGISFQRDTCDVQLPGTPSEYLAEFREYYGPTMNAYAAAAADGREDELHAELEELFNGRTRAATRPRSLRRSCA